MQMCCFVPVSLECYFIICLTYFKEYSDILFSYFVPEAQSHYLQIYAQDIIFKQ